MRKIFIMLTLTFIIASMSSIAFAADYDEARDAMITYSGTEAFTKLLPEERQACMYWIYEGGEMNEICRKAVTYLLSEAPDAVTSSQRKALLAAASGTSAASGKSTSKSKSKSQPVPEKKKSEVKNDNTGALIAAGVAAVVLGLVIHNNMGSSSHSRPSYGPPRPHYRYPAPAPHHRMPPRR